MACGGGPKSATTPSFLRVEDSALPYRIVRASDGREVPREEFVTLLKGSSAICVGEGHTDSNHHWAQLEVLTHLGDFESERWALGMEMFQRPFQGVLDDFSEGRVTEKQLLGRSDWLRRWGHDWRYYAPMVRLAAKRGYALLALNISKELKEKWKASSTNELSADDKARIPEMNLEDEAHRRWFRSLMESMSEGHGTGDEGGHAFYGDPEGAGPSGPVDPTSSGEPAPAAEPPVAEPEADFIDTIYPVQVLWDETMAETATKWLQAGEGRRVLILAGNGHCHNSAIVGRMKRRGVDGVISVRPIVDNGDGEVADSLVSPINDYLFVMTPSGSKEN